MTTDFDPPRNPSGPGVNQRLSSLERRVAELERENSNLRAVLAPTGAMPPPPMAEAAVPQASVGRSAPSVWAQPPAPPPPGPSPATSDPGIWRGETKPAFVWTTELVIKWAGLGLLFLAAAFLVSTAISRGWIGPRLQLTGAALGGFALIAAGLKLRDRKGWVEPLIQVGLSVLFVCSGAAWDWLDLGSPEISTITAVMVGILALALARYLLAWSLGLVGLAGLIIVPLWMDMNDSLGLGYSVLYLLGVLVVFTVLYLERNWATLWVSTVIVTAFLVLLEASDRAGSRAGDSELLTSVGATTTALLGGLLVIYWLAPVVSEILQSQKESTKATELEEPTGTSFGGLGGTEFRVVLLAPAWFWWCTKVFTSMTAAESAAMGLILVIVTAASAVGFRRFVPRAFFITQLMASSIVLTIVLVEALEGPTLLAALALQAAVLVALIRDLDDGWFTVQAVLSGGLALIVTVGRMLGALFDDVAWTDDLTHLFIIALLAGVGVLELRRDEENRALGEFGLLATYVGMLLWVASVFGHWTQGQGLVSAIWSIFAVGLLGFALTRQSRSILRLGLGTLGLVVAKLLTVDLAAVDTFWRVGLFFVIGLGLLALSYQLPRLMGVKPPEPPSGTPPDETPSAVPAPPQPPTRPPTRPPATKHQ